MEAFFIFCFLCALGASAARFEISSVVPLPGLISSAILWPLLGGALLFSPRPRF
jgi:hypothetical protein